MSLNLLLPKKQIQIQKRMFSINLCQKILLHYRLSIQIIQYHKIKFLSKYWRIFQLKYLQQLMQLFQENTRFPFLPYSIRQYIVIFNRLKFLWASLSSKKTFVFNTPDEDAHQLNNMGCLGLNFDYFLISRFTQATHFHFIMDIFNQNNIRRCLI